MRSRRVAGPAAVAVALALSGCSASVLHNVDATYAALCGYHAWRLENDVRSRHLGWAAFEAWRATHTCTRAVRR